MKIKLTVLYSSTLERRVVTTRYETNRIPFRKNIVPQTLLSSFSYSSTQIADLNQCGDGVVELKEFLYMNRKARISIMSHWIQTQPG